MFGIHGDADRAAGVDLDQPLAERLAQPLDDALRGRPQLVDFGALLQHDELVAAQPRQRLSFGQAAGNGQRHRLEQLVAEAMAVVVVDALEVVQVQEQHAAAPALARRERRLQLRGDGMAVGQIGQHVGVGQHAQAFLGLPLLGDVGARTDQIDALFAATAGDELVAEQKQPRALDRVDQALDLVGLAVAVEGGDVAAGGRGLLAGHEHVEHAAPDDVLLALAGVFLAQLVEALHPAVLVDDDDDRVGLRHHGLGEGQALDQVLATDSVSE